MEVLEQKRELIDWILTLENKEILNNVYKFKKQCNSFNFDEEFTKAITSAELKAKTTEFLKSLPWKS